MVTMYIWQRSKVLDWIFSVPHVINFLFPPSIFTSKTNNPHCNRVEVRAILPINSSVHNTFTALSLFYIWPNTQIQEHRISYTCSVFKNDLFTHEMTWSAQLHLQTSLQGNWHSLMNFGQSKRTVAKMSLKTAQWSSSRWVFSDKRSLN